MRFGEYTKTVAHSKTCEEGEEGEEGKIMEHTLTGIGESVRLHDLHITLICADVFD